VDIFDDWGSDGNGFDPGRIPPIPRGFKGELKCVQVDPSGAPLRSNKLIGKATIITNATGDISSYNAVVLKGNPDMAVGARDNVLELNNTFGEGEYDGCPVTLDLSLVTAEPGINNDPVIDDLGSCAPDCPVETEITLVPCSQDLEAVNPGETEMTVFTYDEFEVQFSAAISVDCWFNRRTDDTSIFGSAFFRDSFGVFARFIPGDDRGRVVGVVEEFRTASSSGTPGPTARTAFSIVGESNRVCSDRTLGGRAGLSCASDEDCPGGFCIDGANDQIVIPVFE
jgi:hypothetical protein